VGVRGAFLNSGKTTSCGCNRKVAATAHGRHDTPEYCSWSNMIQRCTNEKDDSYAWYGAKGVAVCSKWLSSFEAFYADMGLKPGKGYVLSRNRDKGDYEPGNCSWKTKSENAKEVNDRRFNGNNGQIDIINTP